MRLRNSLKIFAVFVLATAAFYFSFKNIEGQILDSTSVLARESLPKVVAIDVVEISTAGVQGYLGSGVFISSNGLVLTCAHLFNHGPEEYITVTNSEGVMCRADMLYMEKNRDLALLSTNFYKNKYAKITDPRKLAIGQTLLIIGSPMGFTFSVTHGIISALNRDFPWCYNSVQCDAMVAPGNSGGPAFNRHGEIVGIVSFYIPLNEYLLNNTGLSFMVSAGQIIEFLERFKQGRT